MYLYKYVSIDTILVSPITQNVRKTSDTNRVFIQKDQDKSIMDDKIFIIATGSRISAFLEKK